MNSNIIFLLSIICSFLFQINAGVVKVELTQRSFYETKSNLRTILISIDEAPESDRLIVDVSTSDTSSKIFPSSVVFTSGSLLNTPKEIAFIAGDAATNTIVVKLDGPHQSSYQVEFVNNMNTIEVLNESTEPAKPVALTAIFSNDGESIIINFDSETNQGGFANVFDCSALLTFTSIGGELCNWIDNSNIEIFGSTSVNKNSPIIILGNKILPNCDFCKVNFVDEITLLVLPPTSPISPVVSISTSSTIGGCNSLVMDYSGSTGSGGRPWKSFTYVVTSTDTSSATDIQNYLNSNYATKISPPTPVPNEKLNKGSIYTIEVTMTNFLGGFGSANTIVEVLSDTSIPVASISGQQSRSIVSTDVLSLSTVAFTASCAGGVSTTTTAGLSYDWSVSHNNVALNIVSESKDASKFKLSSLKLSSGNTYDIKVIVTNKGGKSTSVSTSVSVLRAAILSNLNGGSKRTVSIGESITVDASASIDQDVGNGANLEYFWECVQISPLIGDCTLQTSSNDKSSIQIYTPINDNAVGSVNRITVTVSDGSIRSSSKFVDITVASAGSPEVAITTSSNSLTYLNPSKSVVLNGVVSLKGDPCDATWTMNGADITPINALTPVYTTVPSGIARTVSLVLAPGVLTQRSTFVFSLTCKDTVSSISVTTNGPPLPGSFVITPSTGVELDTIFTFSASGWSDPNLPITYMFGFRTASSGLKSMVVQGRSELSFGESVLPSGLASKSYLVTCTVDVFDSLGSSSQAIETTTVTQASAEDLQKSIQSQLDALDTNPDATKQTLSTASAALNQVDCSGTSCAAVNRAECSKTAFTCGVCLPGYIGDAGDKNSPCILSSASFTDVTKTCDNDCSSNGTCALFSSITGLYVDECKQGDSSCEAICECEESYGGVICGSLITELEAKQSIRSSLIDSLSSLTENEDASADTVATWALALGALTQNADEISPASAINAQNVAFAVLSSASSTGLSFDTISSVLAVVDASTTATITAARRRRRLLAKRELQDATEVIAAETIAVEASIAKTVELLGMYGSLVSSQLYPGQDGVTNVLDSFRLSTEAYSSDGSEIIASTPLTDIEVKNGIVASNVALTPSESGGSIKVTTVMTTPKSFGVVGEDFNSNSMHLQLDGSTSNAEVIIVLQNNARVVFNHSESVITKEKYCVKGEISTTTETCADSGFTFNFECQGWVDYLNATCPSQTEQPKCIMLDISGSNSANSCRMVNYTDTETTCACTIVPGSGRRLNALDDSGVTDLVAMSAFVANQFAGTLSTPPNFDSWDDLKKVMIVLLMYGIFWATGLGLISLCIVKRWASQSREKAEKAELAKKRDVAGKLRSPIVIREYLTEYVNSVFPDVFRAKPYLTRMYNEVTKNHRYIYLLTSSGKGSDAGRMLTGIQLLTTQAMLMFLIAVFYELEGPDDDGTCPYFATESTCLARASMFDYSQTYCQFENNICTYKEPEFSWKSIALIGMLIAFATCFLSSPLDFLFNLLSAPTKLNNVVGAVKNIQPVLLSEAFKQVSNVTNTLTQSPDGSNLSTKSRFMKAMKNPNFTTLSELRELPSETEDAYSMARASMNVVSAMATKNRTDRLSVVATLKEQASRENFYKSDETEGDDDEDIVKVIENDTFSKLSDDICCQRRVMKFSQLDDFDDDWGLDPTGAFSKKTEFQYSSCSNKILDTEKIIRAELDFVEKETKTKIEKLKFASEKHIGLEMLHIFVLDLLGHDSVAAKIFITKSEEDYRYTKAVSAKVKGLAWLGLIVINLFFVYYSMMRGMIRGKSWQYAYLAGCIGQILFEIVIAETFEILWVHFIIPNLVANEVKNVWAKIIDTIDSLTTMETSDVAYFIDAPQYLFVSTNLAKAFPDLLESSIIAAYHDHLPGEMASKWHVDRASLMGLTGANNTWIRFLAFSTISTILKFLGASPFVIQRMIMRVTSPLFTAAAVFIWLEIIQNPLYMTIFGLVVIALIARTYYNYQSDTIDIKNIEKSRLSVIIPEKSNTTYKEVANNDDNEIELTSVNP